MQLSIVAKTIGLLLMVFSFAQIPPLVVDLIYTEVMPLQELKVEGSTTTSASILYDILRKLEPDAKVDLSLQSTNKLKLVSGNSKFNLLCMSADNFPLSEDCLLYTSPSPRDS